MRRPWLAAALWGLGTVGARGAGRDEPVPATVQHHGPWTIGVHERVEIAIPGLERVLSYDEGLVSVVGHPPDRIEVSAGTLLGTTTIHVIGPAGIDLVVVEVVPRVEQPTDAASAPGRTSVRATVLTGGRGDSIGPTTLFGEVASWGVTSPDSRLFGSVLVSVHDAPRFGSAVVRLDDPRWRATLGRSGWSLAENTGVAATDLAAFEWGERDAWRLGGFVGRAASSSWTDPSPVGAEVGVSTPRWGPLDARARAFGWIDPELGAQAGGALGASVRTGPLSARGEGFWSGQGGGGSARLDLSPGRFRLHLDGAARSAGVYLPGVVLAPGARLNARVGYEASRWGAGITAAGSRYLGPDGASRRFSLLGIDARVRPSRSQTLWASWQATPSRLVADGVGTIGYGEHWTTLGFRHETSPFRFGALARLRLPLFEGAFSGLDLSADALWRVRGGWVPEASASATIGLASPQTFVSIRGGIQRMAERWSLRAWTGITLDGRERIVVQPMLGASTDVRLHPRHAVGLSAWAGFPSGLPATWQAQVRYTVHPGRSERPVVARGRVVGTAYEDRDLDGVRDPGEAPVAGAGIRVGGETVATTDESGRFVARGVRSGPQGLSVGGGGWIPAGEPQAVEVPTNGTARVELAARAASRVVARPFLDVDGDGVRDPDEPVVRASRVSIVAPDGARVAVGRGSDGFRVTGLPTGPLRVVLDVADVPPGHVSTGALEASFEASPGSSFEVDFPFRALHAVGGRVRIDHNGSGVADNGDPPAVGVTVRCDGQSVVTDENGRFLFRDLPVGTYHVEVDGALQRPQVEFGVGPREVFGLELAIAGHGPVAPEPDAVLVAPIAVTLRPQSDRVQVSPGSTAAVPLYAAWSDGTWRDVAAEATWATSDPAVATVEAGVVTGVAEGRAEITATWEGREVRVVADVAAVHVVGLVMSTPTLEVASGGAARLTVRAILTTGAVEDVTGRVEWTSSDPGVATVSSDGTVIGIEPGTAEIRATLRGVQAFPTTVTVRAP